jgi:hypothetical protein
LRVSHPNCFQWLVIAAFAKAGWPRRIKNPLRQTRGYGPERLTQTVKDLNRKLKSSRLLRFIIDTDRESIRWEAMEE